jgi:hypothetical protein
MPRSRRKSNEAMPLSGFFRLYNAQLRPERKSPKTIGAYDRALQRFASWWAEEQGDEPVLGDYNRNNVRLFLADYAGRPKWQGLRGLGAVKEGHFRPARCIKRSGVLRRSAHGWKPRSTSRFTRLRA